MADLTIRNVPSDLHKLLKKEASHFRRSVNAIAIQALQEHADRAQRLQRMARVVQELDSLREAIANRSGLTSDSADLVREDRSR